jgi:hypothetical protein
MNQRIDGIDQSINELFRKAYRPGGVETKQDTAHYEGGAPVVGRVLRNGTIMCCAIST